METKVCKRCQLDLPKDDIHFASRYDRKEKQFQHMCRSCQKEYRKEHYEKNKQKYVQKANLYSQNFKEWFTEIKKELSCKKCGESRHWVLDFHHTNPAEKDMEISNLVRLSSKKRLMDEVDKCIVLCANCHRDLHYQEQKRE